MSQFRNISKGARGVNTVNGTVMLDPGEMRELEVSAAEMAVAEGTGWFEIDGMEYEPVNFSKMKATPPPKSTGDDGKAARDLLARADRLSAGELRSEAAKVLGEVPSTKAEVIAALEKAAS